MSGASKTKGVDGEVYCGPIPDMDRVEALAIEVERLQKVIADQALTIGALKDENARHVGKIKSLQALRDAMKENWTKERGLMAETDAEVDKLRAERLDAYKEIDRLRDLERHLRQQIEGFELERDHAHHLLSEERRLMAATADEIRNLRGLLRQTLAQHDSGHSPCNCAEIRAVVCP